MSITTINSTMQAQIMQDVQRMQANAQAPVLLVGRDTLPDATRSALGRASAAAGAVVAGGDTVIGPDVRQQVSDALPD